jgi:nicotinamide mononucleotide (NMN) deamidase PncC
VIALGLSGPNPEVSTAKHRAAMLRLHAALAEQRAISERVAEQMLNNAANVLEAGLK